MAGRRVLASPAVPCEAVVCCSDWLWLWLEVTLHVSKGSGGCITSPGAALPVSGGGRALVGNGRVGMCSISSDRSLKLSWCIIMSDAGGAFATCILGGALAGRGERTAGCVGAAATGVASATVVSGVDPASDWDSKKS